MYGEIVRIVARRLTTPRESLSFAARVGERNASPTAGRDAPPPLRGPSQRARKGSPEPPTPRRKLPRTFSRTRHAQRGRLALGRGTLSPTTISLAAAGTQRWAPGLAACAAL